MRICPQCGEENPDRARFCMACSTALAEELPGEHRVRKTVTILFCDMTGSTSLGERLDPESVGRVMGRYYEALKAVIERHGGTVAKFIGDAVMGVFGIPTLHEDDALRAVRSAAEIPHVIESLNERIGQEIGAIQVRVGVNTGEVLAGDPSIGDALATGDAVNVAARLEQAAPPGQILIGRETFRLVRDAVEVDEIERLEVRGKAEPLRAFRLRLVKPGLAGHIRRMDAPMIGRDRQRQLLRHIFDSVRQDLSCHLFTLLGPAGVGKSRLVAELVHEVGHEATVLQGRCLPYGDGITFWPIVEVVRQAAGVVDGDQPDVAAHKIRSFLLNGDELVMPSGFSESPDVLEPLSDTTGLIDSPATNEQRFLGHKKVV
jgi:class 3 adenylate cyclase